MSYSDNLTIGFESCYFLNSISASAFLDWKYLEADKKTDNALVARRALARTGFVPA